MSLSCVTSSNLNHLLKSCPHWPNDYLSCYYVRSVPMCSTLGLVPVAIHQHSALVAPFDDFTSKDVLAVFDGTDQTFMDVNFFAGCLLVLVLGILSFALFYELRAVANIPSVNVLDFRYFYSMFPRGKLSENGLINSSNNSSNSNSNSNITRSHTRRTNSSSNSISNNKFSNSTRRTTTTTKSSTTTSSNTTTTSSSSSSSSNSSSNNNTTVTSNPITTRPPVQTTTTRTPIFTSLPPPVQCKDPFRKVSEKNKTFICCNPIGGVGNNLFIYASAYGIATKLNRTVVLNKQVRFLKFFNVRAVIADDYKCVTKGFSGRGAKTACTFDKKMFDIPKGENYCVGAYLQSYKYFDHVKEDLRKQFTFSQTYKDKAKVIIDKAINTYKQRTKQNTNATKPVLVGVHIRRGDLVNHGHGYDVATPQYMDNATRYFRNKYGRVLFLVCSNGMDWAKKHVTGDDVIYIEGNDYIVDMSLLVSCNHTLSTVGSFSWWAGFLAGGDTVYYQWPARNGTVLRTQYSSDYSDFFPPSWIGMR